MPYQQVTLATLRTRLFERVDTAQHWVNAEARIKLNDALRLWNLLTGFWRRSESKTIQPASDPYNYLSAAMTWPMRMELSTGTPVERTSIAALDAALPGWENQAIGDAGLPTRITFWAPRSLQYFAVWPRPIAATPVTVDGIAETPVLDADGDFIDLPDDVHDVLLAYAAHLLQFKSGGPKFLSTAQSYQDLITLAGEYNDQLRSTTIYKQALSKDHDRDHRERRRPRTGVPDPATPQTPQAVRG